MQLTKDSVEWALAAVLDMPAWTAVTGWVLFLALLQTAAAEMADFQPRIAVQQLMAANADDWCQ